MKTQLSILQLLLVFVTASYAQTTVRIEAETFDEAWDDVRIEENSELSGGNNIGYINSGDWIKFSDFEFDANDVRFDVSASTDYDGGDVEFRLGAADGTLIGTATVTNTGGWGNYQIVSATIAETTGTHDLYLVFTGGDSYLFNLDYFEKVNDGALSIEDNVNRPFKAYPNPTNGNVNLQLPDFSGQFKYAVYTISGQKALNGIVSQDNTINLKDLNKGMYLLNLINDKGDNFNVRVIKN